MNVNVQIVVYSADKLNILENIVANFSRWEKRFDPVAQEYRYKKFKNVTNGKILRPNNEEASIVAVEFAMPYPDLKQFAANVIAAEIDIIRINHDANGASPVLFFEFAQVNSEKRWRKICNEHNISAEIYSDKIICAMHKDNAEYTGWYQSLSTIKKKSSKYSSYRKKEA